MPFACAKAVTATFCYSVRYALTPLFGKDFLDICLPLTDPSFGNFKIDSSIVERCALETQTWLRRSDARFTPVSSREASEIPSTPKTRTLLPPWKKLKPKNMDKAASPESGYGTDTDWSDCTPQISPKTAWATINRPQAQSEKPNAEVKAAEGLMLLASPKNKSNLGKEIPRSIASPERRENGKRPLEDGDEEYEDNVTDKDKMAIDGEGKTLRATDSRAAYMLLQLRLEGTGQDEHREKRPRFRSLPNDLS